MTERKFCTECDAEIDAMGYIHAHQPVTAGLPQDVINLVIAARIVTFEDQSPEALKALDKASEAFAERVPWDNEPDALKSESRK